MFSKVLTVAFGWVFIFKSPEKYIITDCSFKKKKAYENRFKFLTVYFDVERTAILGTFSN